MAQLAEEKEKQEGGKGEEEEEEAVAAPKGPTTCCFQQVKGQICYSNLRGGAPVSEAVDSGLGSVGATKGRAYLQVRSEGTVAYTVKWQRHESFSLLLSVLSLLP